MGLKDTKSNLLLLNSGVLTPCEANKAFLYMQPKTIFHCFLQTHHRAFRKWSTPQTWSDLIPVCLLKGAAAANFACLGHSFYGPSAHSEAGSSRGNCTLEGIAGTHILPSPSI